MQLEMDEELGFAYGDSSMLELLGPSGHQSLLATQPLPDFSDAVFSPSPGGELQISSASSPTAAWSPHYGGVQFGFVAQAPAPLSCQMALSGGTGVGGSGLCSGGSNTADSGVMEDDISMFIEYIEDLNRLEDQKQQLSIAGETSSLTIAQPPPPPPAAPAALSAPLPCTSAGGVELQQNAKPTVLAQLLASPTNARFYPESERLSQPQPVASRDVPLAPTATLMRYSSEASAPTAAGGAMGHSLLMPTSCAFQPQPQHVSAAITRVASQASLCSITSATAVSQQQHSFSALAPPPLAHTEPSLVQHSFPAASAFSTAPDATAVASASDAHRQWLMANRSASSSAARTPRYSSSSYASSVSPPPGSVFASELPDGSGDRAFASALSPVNSPPQTHSQTRETFARPAAAAASEVGVVSSASARDSHRTLAATRPAAPPAAPSAPRQRPLSSSSSTSSSSSASTASSSASASASTSSTLTPAGERPEPLADAAPVATTATASAPVSDEVRDRLHSRVRQRLLASGRPLAEAPAPAPAAPDPEVRSLSLSGS